MTAPTSSQPHALAAMNLQRVPHSKQLQAWDAADEYLLRLLNDSATALPLVIVNDNFGALSLAPTHPVLLSWNDSYLAQQAILKNAATNQCQPPLLAGCHQSLTQCLGNIAKPLRIVMRVPKNNALFQWQLQQVASACPPGSELWLAGMDKHLSKSQFEMVERVIGNATFLPGVKKARVWQATLGTPPATTALAFYEHGYTYSHTANGQAHTLTLQRTPNVFSGSSVDIGARFFIEQFAALAPQAITPEAKVADLGCGNGLLSLCYWQHYPHCVITAVDESFQAIACTQRNIDNHHLQHAIHTTCANGLEDFPAEHFDAVLCNPPFHQHNTVSTDIAYTLFQQAHRALRKGGQLHLVANRHLPYQQGLKRLFGGYTLVNQNHKFVVLSARK